MITAIVILVILAGLGAFVMSVTGMQGGSEALDVGGSRASRRGPASNGASRR